MISSREVENNRLRTRYKVVTCYGIASIQARSAQKAYAQKSDCVQLLSYVFFLNGTIVIK